MAQSTIHVFAGVNGSGKSSILGGFIESQGGTFFNPNAYTRDLMMVDPNLALAEAQSEAWTFGKDTLQDACEMGQAFAFETTLGGGTITHILFNAAKSGTKISIYYIGLNSIELNIERVAARVIRGGHDIPIAKIRQRWQGSLLNVIKLLPLLNELNVYDNSTTVEVGKRPKPELLIRIVNQKIVGGKRSLLREDFPEWAQPIAMEAINLYGS
jgi:predicted ABC-type ATPase